MIRRSTWVVLAVFVVLVGAALYWQRTRDAREASATPMPEQETLFDFAESNVKSLRIEGEVVAVPESTAEATESAPGPQPTGVQVVAAERDESGAWKLIEPPAEQADTARLDSAVRQLAVTSVVSTLSTPPAPEATGLDDPTYLVTITLQDGRQVVLKVGSTTPVNNAYYVQVDEGPVQVVSQFALDSVTELMVEPPIIEATPTAESTLPAEQPAATEQPEGEGTPSP